MSLRALSTVNRSTSWRARLPLYDRVSFQPLSVGHLGEAQNATIALGLFPDEDDCTPCCGLSDYGQPFPWRRRPLLSVSTDDGTGFLVLESADPAQAVILNVPPYQVAAIPQGIYRVPLAAVYADGTVIDCGSSLVAFRGEAISASFNSPMMAGGPQPAGTSVAVNGVIVTMPPILPSPLRAPYA